MKQKISLILIYVIALILLLSVFFLAGRCSRSRPPEQVTPPPQQPIERDTIHDSVEVIKQPIIIHEKIKEGLSKEDKQLIKDLGIKISALESYQNIGMQTGATVTLSPDSTSLPDVPPADTLLTYHDAWLDLRYNTNSRNLDFKSRDSLAIAIEKLYKHRFLWLRWKVKGYDLKVANFNPHSTIKYSSYLKTK